MDIQFGKKFVELMATALQFFCLTSLCPIGLLAVFYITLFTRLWYLGVLYLIWIWIIDKDTSESGGRSVKWFRNLKLFEFARDYFPVTLTAVPGFQLDPKRNYMFCCFPHGIMPNGIQIALSSTACGVDNIIPSHTIHPTTLHLNFKIPIFRDYLLAIGACSVTPKSINWLLSYPEGGKIAAILVGGAAEASYANPGVYTIVLKNRKGFVKLALRNGSPLVPVFSFGEVDVFKQMQVMQIPLVQRFQNWVKDKIRISPVLFRGRGYYQPYVGLIPYRKPINVVVGKPIDVVKNKDPSQEDIDKLHRLFVHEINELFEKYKHKYIENADTTTLSIV